MTVSFQRIPSNIKVPLFYAEMDNSQAGYFTQNQKTLILGQKLAAGTAVANVPVQVPTTDNAKALFGVGSMLARMHEISRLNDPFAEIWCIPLDEPAAGVKAAGTITVTGTPTEAGTLFIYIAGQQIQVAVDTTSTPTSIAAAIVTAITAATSLPVVATSAAGVVTVTSKWKGASGNDVIVQLNYRGAVGGEKTPAGITVVPTALTSGTASPDLTAAIDAMGDDQYDYIINPFNDSTSLDALKTELGDVSGRWSYIRQLFGGTWTAMRGTYSALTTFGSGRNDQHNVIAGFEASVPNPLWEYAAAYATQCAASLSIDPARPTQTLDLVGILPALPIDRFIITERQGLLNNGIATSFFGGGSVCVERSITTYQKNNFNQPDPSYLDVETLYTSSFVIRYLKQRLLQKYPRHKLANDGTRFGAGQAIVTPAVLRGEILAAYSELELQGIVENSKAFAAALIVERDGTNPNRVNVLFPPDYVNQLRILAVLNQFRLQYAA